jgi:CRISPR/Cas system endoribonuclease Cas6 (RAMP superfamily)
MILSIIVQLEAHSTASLDQFTGKGVHGFWFNRWRKIDRAFGDALHEKAKSGEVQEFTLSPLMGLPRSQRGVIDIQPGTKAYFRITTLTDDLSIATQNVWMKSLADDPHIRIPGSDDEDEDAGTDQFKIDWKVLETGIEAQADYEALSRSHLMNSAPPRKRNVKFESPTTFHASKEIHLPIPLPDSLIGSWLRRWNEFAPIALPKDELIAAVREQLAVSSYQLRTLPAREGKSLRVGCTGRMTLSALGMPPYLRACVDLLAHYARYCGSGSHTAQGLGQTR